MSLENTILSNVLMNKEYFGKVYPYLNSDYFDDFGTKKIFDTITDFVEKYQEPPSLEALTISLEARGDLNEDAFKGAKETIKGFKVDPNTNVEWLVNETEKFCQDKALFNAIRKSILILDGNEKKLDKGSIPKLVSDALSINFDTHVGHDFLEDAEARFEYYNRKESRLPFDIDILNKITNGGIPPKSMTVFMGGSGSGKSIVKCHMAANNLLQGKNVLYITMELAEEEVARRIDANMMRMPVQEVKDVPKDVLEKRMARFKTKTAGKLIIKEYPTGSAHVGHFRHLINELRQKKGFVPDVIYLDYLNICASSRVKGTDSNSYSLVKSIAEEVRGLAMEFAIPIVTSTQLNRSGYNNSDVDMTNTSESMGIVHTADCLLALIASEEMDALKQITIKQLKNRWGDISRFRKFVIGMDKERMSLYNTESTAQDLSQGPTHAKSEDDMDDSTLYEFKNKPKKKSFKMEGLQ